MSRGAGAHASAADLQRASAPARTRAAHALLWAVILFELSPAGHAARLAALAWSQVAFGGPVAAALAYGGSTFAIEAAAALAAAILATARPRSPRGWAARRVDRVASRMAERVPIHPVTTAGVAVVGGSAVAIWLRHIDAIPRGRTDLRRFGLLVALGIGSLSAVQGALIAQGIAAPSPATIGAAAIAVALIPLVARAQAAARCRSTSVATRSAHPVVDGAPP